MKKILMIVLCVVLCCACVFTAGGCSAGSASGESQSGKLAEGDKAYDFTAELASGETFKLSDHEDEVVLLNFWATWCGYCVDEMLAIQKLQDDNIPKVRIIEMNCAETKDEVDAFIKENGFTMDFAYDEDGKIGTKYQADLIPYTVIVKDGIAERIFVGVPADNIEDTYQEYKTAVLECLEL